MGVQLLSRVHIAQRGKTLNVHILCVEDGNDLCPPGYLVNAVQSLENVSRIEQITTFPAAVRITVTASELVSLSVVLIPKPESTILLPHLTTPVKYIWGHVHKCVPDKKIPHLPRAPNSQ